MKRVIDASVAIAWYLPESFSKAARDWRDRMVDERVHFFAPSLHFWEVGNALRTCVKRGELSEDIARDIYRTHLAAPIERTDPKPDDLLSVAFKYQATLYDAVYIALALETGSPLLTAEKTTTAWVTRLGRLADSVV